MPLITAPARGAETCSDLFLHWAECVTTSALQAWNGVYWRPSVSTYINSLIARFWKKSHGGTGADGHLGAWGSGFPPTRNWSSSWPYHNNGWISAKPRGAWSYQEWEQEQFGNIALCKAGMNEELILIREHPWVLPGPDTQSLGSADRAWCQGLLNPVTVLLYPSESSPRVSYWGTSCPQTIPPTPA